MDDGEPGTYQGTFAVGFPRETFPKLRTPFPSRPMRYFSSIGSVDRSSQALVSVPFWPFVRILLRYVSLFFWSNGI